MYLHSPHTDFSAMSPTLIRKITLLSRLAVNLVWSVPPSVADDDGFMISAVMVTPSGPSTIQRSIAGKCVNAYPMYFSKEGTSYKSQSTGQ